MARKNYRKETWFAGLYKDTDGRSGVTNYAGHVSHRGIGIHVELDKDPTRPVTVLIDNPADIDALAELIEKWRAGYGS